MPCLMITASKEKAVACNDTLQFEAIVHAIEKIQRQHALVNLEDIMHRPLERLIGSGE